MRAGRGQTGWKNVAPGGLLADATVDKGQERYSRGPDDGHARYQPIDSGRNEAGHAKETLRETTPCTTLSQRTVRAKAQPSKTFPAQVSTASDPVRRPLLSSHVHRGSVWKSETSHRRYIRQHDPRLGAHAAFRRTHAPHQDTCSKPALVPPAPIACSPSSANSARRLLTERPR